MEYIYFKTMESRFMFETIEKIVNTNEQPIKYVLPINPNIAYKQIEHQIPKNSLKQTERCPFPQIRQLFVVYFLQKNKKDLKKTEPQYPNLLAERYEENIIYKAEDQRIINAIEETQSQIRKIKQILKCTKDYIKLYSQVEKGMQRDYRRDQDRLYQQAKNVAKDKKPHQRLQFYQNIKKSFSETNTTVLNIENKYFEFISYAKQFERALILVAKQQSIELKNEDLKKGRQIQFFLNELDGNRINLTEHLEKLIDILFEWRQEVKKNQVTEKSLQKNKETIQQKGRFLHDKARNIYLQVNGVSNIIINNRKTAEQTYQKVSGGYKKFLLEYIKVKQFQKFQNEIGQYQDIINQEKKLFTAHLKNNYGMAVTYKLSPQYTNQIMSLNTKDKQHLKQLVNYRLKLFELALNFINEDYSKYYQEACKGVSIKLKLKKKKQQFNQFEKKQPIDQQYLVHVQENFRRLLEVSNQSQNNRYSRQASYY